MILFDFPSQVDLQQKVSAWAHDLRSPFNHVIGFTKIVLNGQSGPLTDLQKEDLTTVYRSALRAMSFLNNLIEIARLQRGEKEINRVPVELSAMLKGVIAQWQRNNPGLDSPIAVILPVPPPTVVLDKQQMGWILGGFFSYLVAYADGTGRLTVEVSVEKGSLLFSLRHEGITKTGHDKIMLDMYGTICRAYIELQGGQILQGEADKTTAGIKFSIPAGAL